MYISIPQQALCSDRRQLSGGPSPDLWISQALPAGWSLHNFHFFVNWTHNPPRLGQEVWMTRLVHFHAGESPLTVSGEAIGRAFESGNDGSILREMGRFCASYGHNLSGVILPEIPAASVSDSTPVWEVLCRGNGHLTVEVHTLSELKTRIRRESGGPVRVGSKGLIYGTSAVECVLSKTDSAYPGDVDAVVFDSDGVVRCVVEYKKHTLNSAIGDHLIDKYYPYPDGRKYQRLYALVSHYRQATPGIPFIVLYFATKFPIIRLQMIGELTPQGVEIQRDSGDWNITGMRNDQVAARIIDWLGVTR